jgi:small subunit ribosomal protein S5
VAALRQLEEPRAVAARRGLDVDRVVPERLLRAEAEHTKHEAEIAKAASK